MNNATFTLAGQLLGLAFVLGGLATGAALVVMSSGGWHEAGGWLMVAILGAVASFAAGYYGLVTAGRAADKATRR